VSLTYGVEPRYPFLFEVNACQDPVFEFDINWDEHSGACEDVHVFGFIGPSYFSIQYIVPEKWCGEKGFTLTVDFVLVSLSLTCD
jgi:hypothetical protein